MASDSGNIVKFGKKSKKSGQNLSRAEKERRAAANRFRAGRTGAEKKLAKARREKERRLFEGKKLSGRDEDNGNTGETPE